VSNDSTITNLVIVPKACQKPVLKEWKTEFEKAKEGFEQAFSENPLELRALIINSLSKEDYPIFQYFNTKVMPHANKLEKPFTVD